MEGEQRRIPVIETATGRIVLGMEAPTASELDAFLSANPGWEVLPSEDSDTSEDEAANEEGDEGEYYYFILVLQV